MGKRMTFAILIMNAQLEMLNSSEKILGRLPTSLAWGTCPLHVPVPGRGDEPLVNHMD